MNEAEIRAYLEAALWRLVEKDRYLFENDLSERCIASRLAMYLQADLSGYDVDIEYDREDREPKRMGLPEECGNRRDRQGRVRVIPDVIVHRRGAEGPNVLVLEMKKTTNREPRHCDRRRVIAFRKQLGYKFGALIECQTGAQQEPAARIKEWFAG